jgi:hypothetical protein
MPRLSIVRQRPHLRFQGRSDLGGCPIGVIIRGGKTCCKVTCEDRSAQEQSRNGACEIETAFSLKGHCIAVPLGGQSRGLLVNSGYVVGFCGPFIGFRRRISARFCCLCEFRPSAILGFGAKPDGRELECAITPVGTDRLAAPVIWALRGPANAGA